MMMDDTGGPEAQWRAALAEGRILLQRDMAHHKYYFPPRFAAPDGQALEWVEASGKGTVYSWTEIFPRPPEQPYNVALVDLEEGVRIMSRVDGVAPGTLTIGAAVKASVFDTDEGPLIVCHPA